MLIDTNIIIYREDHKELDADLQKLMPLLHQEEYSIYVHPASIQDINNDKDEQRKKITLSKLKSYPVLETPPDYISDREFIGQIPRYAELNSHDLIDLALLYSLYRHAVSYLITEDAKIHSWAKIFNLENCFEIQEAVDIFLELTAKPQDVFKPLPIKYLPLSNLKLEDPFFDGLKEDYDKILFEKWFNKKAEQGYKAYVYFFEDGSLGAFLMLKPEENEHISSKPTPIFKKKILKICTLKVSKNGNKLGELFLNFAFTYAIKNHFDEIYLTHFVKENDYLVTLIENFGFIKSQEYLEHPYTDKKEALFFKNLKTSESVSPSELRTQYFPSFYDGESVRKFIIPIQPHWHDRLFYDQRKQALLLEYWGEFCVEGNTIQKAYLTHSKCKQIREGDIVLFYHSNNDQRISCLGTVDNVFYNVSSVSEVSSLVGKRTVYTLKEIEELVADGPITVILFKYHFPLQRQLSSKELINKEILNGPPQSIMQLDNQKYIKLKREAKIPVEFTHWG